MFYFILAIFRMFNNIFVALMLLELLPIKVSRLNDFWETVNDRNGGHFKHLNSVLKKKFLQLLIQLSNVPYLIGISQIIKTRKFWGERRVYFLSLQIDNNNISKSA